MGWGREGGVVYELREGKRRRVTLAFQQMWVGMRATAEKEHS